MGFGGPFEHRWKRSPRDSVERPLLFAIRATAGVIMKTDVIRPA